ncbi:MAG TPA: TIM barrel protein [Terriglobia bacterium]|nr:TIM barrel protein [Terriglobia bacterium]
MGIRVASAPVSWGITENVEFPADYPYTRVLDEIAAAGYSGTELGPYGFLPAEAPVLRQELEKRSLALCSAFVAMQLGNAAAHSAGFAHVRRSADLISAAGARLLVLSDEITPARSAVAGRRSEANALSWNDAEWRAAASAIGQVAEDCKAVGLRVAFHHHAGTHVETPEEIDRLLALVPAEELGLCLDTGHYVYGGGDAVAFLQKQVSRVWCVHLKDVYSDRATEARRQRMDFHTAVRHGIFAPLGKGNIDFSGVVAILQKGRFDGWVVVEADVLAGGAGADAPLANAAAGRQYLRRLGV